MAEMDNSSDGRSEDDGGPPQESAERAADEAVASDRFLPGEDPSSREADDATRWIAVYSELLTFKQRILQESTEEAAAMSAPAKRELF